MEVTGSNVPDNEASAGATPAAADATSTQSQAATAAAGTDTTTAASATDGAAALGDAGKKALDSMKSERDAAQRAAKAAEKALEDFKLAGASDSDKALAKAKSDGAAEVTQRWTAQVRRSEVKAALTAAGINPSVLDYVVRGDEFASLKVTEDGEVEGLATVIDAFKKAKADLFTKPAAAGTADGGSHGAPGLTRDQIAKMSPDEINRRWDEVSKALPTAR